MPFDLGNIAKWLIIIGLLAAAILGLAAFGGSLAGAGTDAIGHFFHTYQGSIDPEVPNNTSSVMSPQTWAVNFVLGSFGSVWSVLFGMLSAFLIAWLAFVFVRYLIGALS